MPRGPSTSSTPADEAPPSRRPASFARLLLSATLLCLALSATPAMAFTGAPQLIAPVASSAHNSPLSVEYKLPEAGTNAKITFTPISGSPIVVTLTSAAAAAGKHHFFLDLHQLASETANVTEASASTVPDGEYTVTVSYQDLALDPAASASAEKVRIKTSTLAPTVFQPTPGQTFRKPFTVSYALPEAALPGSVKLVLTGTHTEAKTFVLSGTSAGPHTAEIVPANPPAGTGISSGPAERLPTDSYQLTLSYQDTLANPSAGASAISVGIAYPLCEAGTYSASGEEPCTNAPKGYFVQDQGATKPNECPLGHFADVERLTECLPALPGSYVSATGAREELECEQGTYNPASGQSSCLPAPFVHSAPNGGVSPTAGPAGHFDAHTNSPSAEFCEYDSPGSYSGEGADEPIPCVPGKYAFAYGSEACLPAPPGSFVSTIGATDPTPCPAGTYAPASESVSCENTPEDTYATGGASEPTPCPDGTHAPAAASSCTATGNQSSAGAASTTSTSPGTSTTTGASTTPASVLVSPAAHAAVVTIATAKRGPSLVRTRVQRYAVTCSTAASVQLRVSALVRAGHSHLALTAATSTLKCKAGKASEAAAAFKLTSAAKALLHKHGARVTLTVRAYTTADAGGGAPLASASVPGKP
ncbi:MAG: hypothetical protein ACYDHT_06540 [Solirubrobacteraceae bacterium]